MLGDMRLTGPIVDDMLDALIATGGPFDDAALFAGLATAVADNGLNTVIGNVTKVTGAAGVLKPVTWGTPYVLNDGSAVVDSAPIIYTPAGVETAAVAAVYLGDSTVPVTLKTWLPEAPPVTISATHPYSAVLRLTVDPSARWSVSFSWNS